MITSANNLESNEEDLWDTIEAKIDALEEGGANGEEVEFVDERNKVVTDIFAILCTARRPNNALRRIRNYIKGIRNTVVRADAEKLLEILDINTMKKLYSLG